MRYREASRRDFDAIATTDGAVYHQRGGYEIINDDGDVLTPVNRSYRQLEIEQSSRNTHKQISRSNYTNHDRVINDSIEESLNLRTDENLVRIYGKPIFCLNTSRRNIWQEFSTDPNNNPPVSKESLLLVEQLITCIDVFGDEARIGIYGSHQIGLNRDDSDLDLIAWTPVIDVMK